MEQVAVYIAVAVLAALTLILGAIVAYLIRRKLEAHGGAEAPDRAALEVELAVERERAGRVPGLEQELADARGGREQAEVQLAALKEAKTNLEASRDASNAELARLKEELESAQRAVGSLQADLAGLRETLRLERERSAEKLKDLTEAKEAMTREFQVLANDLMSKHGEAFTKQNKEQLDGLLSPLKEKLKEFQEGLQKAHEDTGKERATLAEQIRHLSEQSARMSTETVNLTKALKGSAQMQGAWGEMVLESLLEKSGLREGEEYVRQVAYGTDDGSRLRADVVVNLPGGQHVVIDSKVSMVAFETYVNAQTDEERELALVAHLGSVRAHIKTLAGKEYHAASGGNLDYVIMFVPIEGALAVALQRDPHLTSFAVQNNVAIATPTTLMIALRTIENVWKVERRNQNAEAIADRAGHLYNKFVGFLDDMQSVGQRLGQAQSSYTAAMGKLQQGSGNLIGQVEKLKELGAKTTKSLPRGMLIDEGLTETSTTLLAAIPENSDGEIPA